MTRVSQSLVRTATQGRSSPATGHRPRSGSAWRIGIWLKAFDPRGTDAHPDNGSQMRVAQSSHRPVQRRPLQAEVLDEEPLALPTLDVLAARPPLEDGDGDPRQDSGQGLEAHWVTCCPRPG